MTPDQRTTLKEYFDLLLEIDPQKSFGSLKKAFVDPVKDAAKVSSGEIKKVAVKTGGALAKVTNMITSILPVFFDNKFKEINTYVKDQINSIETENKEAWAGITPHTRTAGAKLFFMADPAGFIASASGKMAADDIADVTRPFLDTLSSNAISSFTSKVSSRVGLGKSDADRMKKWFLNDLNESFLNEAVVSDDIMKNIVKSPEFKGLINSSPLAAKFKHSVEEIGNTVAADFKKIADAASNATTLEDMRKDFGVTLSQADVATAKKSGVNEASLVDTMRSEILKKLTSSITNHIKNVGFDESSDNPYYTSLKGVLDHVTKLTSAT